MPDDELTPAQRDVLDQIGATPDQRPTFDDELRHQVRAELEHQLADIVGLLDDPPLFVNKRRLDLIHRDEVRFLEEERSDDFTVTVPIARGAVTHKAIELSVFWRFAADPLDLTDEAIARLEHQEHWLSEWLRTCTEADRAELRAAVVERLTKYLDGFPPLKKQWWPVLESSQRMELCDAQIILGGRCDLQLGRPEGTRAGRVLVDFKTGGAHATHRDDLRFYALIETVRSGVPPRQLATYYLDQGRLVTEDVREATLHAAIARTIDGVSKMAELLAGIREPVAPSPSIWNQDHTDATDDEDDGTVEDY